MKIVFIGAGIGALVAAEKLARHGCEVSVYEQKNYDTITYDWHDDIAKSAFDATGLPMPKEGTYFVKKNWSFLPPSEKVELTLGLSTEDLDLSIERRALAQQYIDRAKDVVDFHFDTSVESLIIEDECVKGIVVGGEEIRADLVVDNSGAMSKFRASLPASAGIQAKPDKDEVFVAYRAFYDKKPGVPDPENSNRLFLKHLGQNGISWALLDPDGTVDVLIGRTDALPKEVFDEAIAALKVSNPEIGENVVRGGITAIIPIRYPLTKMFTDGYVAIGDSAFMTIPLMGSGMESSMKAACILAKHIIENESVGKEVLWKYQREYYVTRGAGHVGVDVMKRWLLSCDADNLNWLMEKGIITASDMSSSATGGTMKLSFGEVLKKAVKGISRLPFLLKMSKLFKTCDKAVKVAEQVPEEYDEAKIAEWEAKVNSYFAK